MNTSVVLIAAAGLVIAADASTKAAALHLPAAGVGHRSFGLRLVLNRRGNLPGVTTPTALGILALIATVSAIVAGAADVATVTAAALGLALGGAVGNIVDRLRRGAVVDFVVVGRWPVFNVADVALVGGVVLAVTSVVA